MKLKTLNAEVTKIKPKKRKPSIKKKTPDKKLKQVPPETNFIDEADAIIKTVKKEFAYPGATFGNPTISETEISIGVRYWGEWMQDYDDDDEDSDFEILTLSSKDKLEKINNKLKELFNELKIKLIPGEKNWIHIYVSKK